MKVYSKGVVYDFDTEMEYILEGVDYDNGFRGGNGYVLCVDGDNYAAVQKVETTRSSQLSYDKIKVSTVAQLKNYSFKENR